MLCCRSLLTHCHNSCVPDWPAQACRHRKAVRDKGIKLKLLLLYSIHTTYRKIQMTGMEKSLSKTSMPTATVSSPSLAGFAAAAVSATFSHRNLLLIRQSGKGRLGLLVAQQPLYSRRSLSFPLVNFEEPRPRPSPRYFFLFRATTGKRAARVNKGRGARHTARRAGPEGFHQFCPHILR